MKMQFGWFITHFIYESKNAENSENEKAFLLIHFDLNYGTDSLS